MFENLYNIYLYVTVSTGALIGGNVAAWCALHDKELYPATPFICILGAMLGAVAAPAWPLWIGAVCLWGYSHYKH